MCLGKEYNNFCRNLHHLMTKMLVFSIYAPRTPGKNTFHIVHHS